MKISEAQECALVAAAKHRHNLPRRSWWFHRLESSTGDDVRRATINALLKKDLLEQGERDPSSQFGHWYRLTADGMNQARKAIDDERTHELARREREDAR